MSPRIHTNLGVSPELAALLEATKDYVMTPEERREQAISFAYGNGAIDNPDITRESVEEALAKLEASGEISFK